MSRIMIVNPLSMQKFAAEGKTQPVPGQSKGAGYRHHRRRAFPAPHDEGVGRGPGRALLICACQWFCGTPPLPDPVLHSAEERGGGNVKMRPPNPDLAFA